MKHTRATVAIGVAVGLAIWSGLAAAQSGPPAGKAESTVAQVGDQLALGHTSADTEGEGTATANVLEIGGQPPSEQFGGTQTGAGTSSGHLIDTADNIPGARLQVAPWEASNGTADGCRVSSGDAAVARADATGVASADVMQSSTDGQTCETQSTGNASADGAAADVNDGAARADVLHSERGTEGNSEARVASVNDQSVGDDEQINNACAVAAPADVSVGCLSTSGGEQTSAMAVNAGANQALGVGETSSSAVDPAPVGTGTEGEPGGSPSDDGGTGGAPSGEPGGSPSGGSPSAGSPSGDPSDGGSGAPASGSSTGLAATGQSVWHQLVVGVALLALGSSLFAARRVLALRRVPTE